MLDVFRQRSLSHVGFPYVSLDAAYPNGRSGGAVTACRVVVAAGVTQSGDREVLRLAVGDSEDGAVWTESLRARGRRRYGS